MLEQVHHILARYRDDQGVLDAFWQWASNPTPMSAGYALDENYACSGENLRQRYGADADRGDPLVSADSRRAD